MAVSNVYTLSHFLVDRASDLVVGGIQSCNVDGGVAETILSGDGSAYPTFAGIGEIAPIVDFTTTQLATVLAEGSDTFAVAGLKLSATAIGKCWLQKMSEGAVRAGGATSVLMAINEGLLIPTGITAQGNTPATIDCRAVCTYDGSNVPLTVTDSATMSGTPTVGHAYYRGPVEINGSAIDGIQGIAYDPGLRLVVKGDDLYPSFVSIYEVIPRFTFTPADAGVLYDYGFTGTPQNATDSLVYFRKGSEGGTRTADATEEHIKFTIDEGMIWTASVAGTHGQPSVPTLILQPTYDGDNAIVVVDTTSAIA